MPAVGPRRAFTSASALLSGLFVAAALNGCAHAARLVPGHPLGIVLLEDRLRPADIVATAGPVRVSVANDGRVTHNLVIVRPTPVVTTLRMAGTTTTLTSTTAARTPDLAPGTRTSFVVTLAPGRYPIASQVDDDQGQGEQGTLTVVSAPTG